MTAISSPQAPERRFVEQAGLAQQVIMEYLKRSKATSGAQSRSFVGILL
ncbi:MAG: hypothetical protein WDN23_22185 [Edaphobacter sp.]